MTPVLQLNVKPSSLEIELKRTALGIEIERTMDNFFATATNEQFWDTLEDAGWSVFSKIDVPVLNYYSRVSGRYTVTAKQVSPIINTGSVVLSYAPMLLLDGSVAFTIIGPEMDDHRAANNNELALAA